MMPQALQSLFSLMLFISVIKSFMGYDPPDHMLISKNNFYLIYRHKRQNSLL